MRHTARLAVPVFLVASLAACASAKAVTAEQLAAVRTLEVAPVGSAPTVIADDVPFLFQGGLVEIAIQGATSDDRTSVATTLQGALPDWDAGLVFAEECRDLLRDTGSFGGDVAIGHRIEIEEAGELREAAPGPFTSTTRVVARWNRASYLWADRECPAHGAGAGEARWVLEPFLSYVQLRDEETLVLQAAAKLCDSQTGTIVGYVEPTMATYHEIEIDGLTDIASFQAEFRGAARIVAGKLLARLGLLP